jgi:PAS domain S-box-containing protein
LSQEIHELLRKTPIFSVLDSDSLKGISSLFQEKAYSPGDILFRENTLGDALYIITSGEIEIIKEGKRDEGKTILALRRKGDIFGEMSLLGEEPRFATAIAVKKTNVLELSKSDFVSMLSDQPLVAYQIMRVLSSRVRQSDLHMIEELRRKNEQLCEAYENLKAFAEALRETNQQLMRTKNFLERIISTSPYSIVATTLDNTISLLNKTAEKEYGYGSEEVIGRKVETLRGRANLLNLDELIEEALERKGIWQGEIIARRKDGQHFVSDTTVSNVSDHMGHVSAILHISKDITAEKNLSRQALELERMATRGEMAGQVAHELNNYLQVVLGNLDLASSEMNRNTDRHIQERMCTIRGELEKMSCFIHTLMDFAVPQSIKKSIDLIHFVEKELFFLRPQNRFDNIIFRTDFDERLPPIEADPGQIQQLLYNLMNNAADALRPVSDRQGTIGIGLRHLRDEGEVHIEIKDNGVGISKGKLPKVFKERFTTKEKGHGFGLLSVRRVVESHQGQIQVEGEEGIGTRFIIRLPIKQPKPAQAGEHSLMQPVCQEKQERQWT